MSKISSEWDSVIAVLRSKQQQPTYMASGVLSLISLLDRGAAQATEPISVSAVLDCQTEVLERAGCEQVTPAFQGVFHLSQTTDVWSFEKDGAASSFESLTRKKPRSVDELLEHADTLLVNAGLTGQLLTRPSRSDLARAFEVHVRESDDSGGSDSVKLTDHIARVFT